MAKPRYLTKSRFKLACECETKLNYTKEADYTDQASDDLNCSFSVQMKIREKQSGRHF